MRRAWRLLSTITLTCSSLACIPQLAAESTPVAVSDGVTVDLRNPVFKDGVLSTNEGGVISNGDIRIQAQKMRYIRRDGPDGPEVRVEAEEQLMLEYGDWVFVAQAVEYDLESRTGTLFAARTALDAWYVGGKIIDLHADGSFNVQDAYITSCENIDNEWQVVSDEVLVHKDRTVEASGITFRFVRLPVFWFPKFKGNLESFLDSPIRYRFGVGGHDRFLASMRYRMFSVDDWHTYLRLDYRARRGPGAGIETEFRRPDLSTIVLTRNYIANDSTVFDPDLRTRYRVEGKVRSEFGENERYKLEARWDWLSDEDMPSDYQEKDFNLQSAGRTELLVRRQDDAWLANLYARARVNKFQTVKQELPTVQAHVRPVSFGESGFILDNRVELGYIDLQFANDLTMTRDFHAFRSEYNPHLYRPFKFGPVTMTPDAEFIGIYYGNAPGGSDEWLLTGSVGGSVRAHLYKAQPQRKVLVTPYISAHHWFDPTSSPTEHFIFDQDDGWTELNHVELGFDYQIYRWDSPVHPHRFSSRCWVDWFPDTPTLDSQWHRVHAQFVWDPYPTVRHAMQTSLDIARLSPGYFNWRSAWTFTEDLALAAEFRYRNAYTWRKANVRRFMLEAFHNEDDIKDSGLSDRRNTVLLHAFWRVAPTWALELESRHGWNRRSEPDYNEFQFTLHTILRCSWHVELSYSLREHEQRVGLYVQLKEGAPKRQRFIPKDPLELP